MTIDVLHPNEKGLTLKTRLSCQVSSLDHVNTEDKRVQIQLKGPRGLCHNPGWTCSLDT